LTGWRYSWTGLGIGGCRYVRPPLLDAVLNLVCESLPLQVILSGHIPPGPGLYFPDCYFRYGQISLRFQDTIVGHLYGHMNIDHFFWVDIEDVMEEPREPDAHIHMRAKEFEALYQREELHNTLHKDFKDLSERRKVHYDDYAVINVGPSVIPEYLPSFRIFQYNTTGYDGPLSLPSHAYRASASATDADGGKEHEERRKKGSKRKHGHRHPGKPDCSRKGNKDRWACRPWGPRHASPDSPSRSNRLWSLLGYAQVCLWIWSQCLL
jgi:endopolyphosphatase